MAESESESEQFDSSVTTIEGTSENDVDPEKYSESEYGSEKDELILIQQPKGYEYFRDFGSSSSSETSDLSDEATNSGPERAL